jgi:hypothetical protein
MECVYARYSSYNLRPDGRTGKSTWLSPDSAPVHYNWTSITLAYGSAEMGCIRTMSLSISFVAIVVTLSRPKYDNALTIKRFGKNYTTAILCFVGNEESGF